MAGHSKWANIRHRKNAQDAKKGKIFTKMIREITVAARIGGDEIMANPRLRIAVDKALAQNMTRETIERAIKRGAGKEDEQILEEVRYEGYAAHGVAVLVDCLTDNRNRTVAEVRHAFSKLGGNLGTSGSVSYLFQHLGQIIFAPGADEAQLLELAIEAGAQDVNTMVDGSIEIISSRDAFEAVQTAMAAHSLQPAQAEVTWVPTTYVSLAPEQTENLLKLIDLLEDLDDVQTVYVNADFA
jgi:YebC/PmpR family DNA-binding regulatory protein